MMRSVAAYLFGSYAEGHARSDSDIDIGLLLFNNSNVGAMYPVHIAGELEDAAGTKREIDVRIFNNGTLRFLHQVLKGYGNIDNMHVLEIDQLRTGGCTGI